MALHIMNKLWCLTVTDIHVYVNITCSFQAFFHSAVGVCVCVGGKVVVLDTCIYISIENQALRYIQSTIIQYCLMG